LVAPALGNYRYTVVSISHGIGLYPVWIFNHLSPRPVPLQAYPVDKEEQALAHTGEIPLPPEAPPRADSEDELKKELRIILSSPEMKRVIETLIAQSEALSSEAR
jgi:hypothetical protein